MQEAMAGLVLASKRGTFSKVQELLSAAEAWHEAPRRALYERPNPAGLIVARASHDGCLCGGFSRKLGDAMLRVLELNNLARDTFTAAVFDLLIGKVLKRRCIYLWGEADGGKSSLIEPFDQVLVPGSVHRCPSAQTDPRWFFAALPGTRLAVWQEVSWARVLKQADLSEMKKYLGGECISVEEKGGEFVPVAPPPGLLASGQDPIASRLFATDRHHQAILKRFRINHEFTRSIPDREQCELQYKCAACLSSFCGLRQRMGLVDAAGAAAAGAADSSDDEQES